MTLSKTMPILLDIKQKKIHDIQKIKDCTGLIQRVEIVKISQKFVFSLISANKDSFCSDIQTYFL